jgi:adenosylcobyric acid synthase
MRTTSHQARALMVLGTASHVGKSLISAALCRIFADAQLRVRPFKAQNMSLNSAATPDGGEIGRAQALQAEAARVPASVDMNPILLKPTGDARSQVVVLGRPTGDSDARHYHRERVGALFPLVVAAYERLAADADLIVLEGAGSPAEINLRAGDIVNMRMAEAADAACLLVADIDRGGMFAALAGTLLLLEPHERARIRGFIVNKFRGDIDLLRPGIAMLEERIGIRCAGVVPYLAELGLDEEDGVSRDEKRRRAAPFAADTDAKRRLRVAVVALPHTANDTDFDALEAEPSVHVRHIDDPADIALADVVIIPGSKSTIADFDWLVERGLAAAIQRHAARHKPLVGICAGMQMLGESVADPLGVEGGGTRRTLGLLPLATTLAAAKTTRRVAARYAPPLLFGRVPAARDFDGYEIHQGQTERDASVMRTADHAWGDDGATSADGMVVATYVHGLFGNDGFRAALLAAARAAAGLAPAAPGPAWQRDRDARLARWATHVAEHIDLPFVSALVGR